MVEKDAAEQETEKDGDAAAIGDECACRQDDSLLACNHDELQQIQKVIEEKDEYLLLAQRVQADFDNFRKRNRSAISDACQSTIVETVGFFLPVLDNLNRALESAKGNAALDTVAKGIDMVVKQFNDVLKQLEVEEIEALDKEFTPELHNAVLKVEDEQEKSQYIVAEVFQKGYKYKDRVIRHSMVKVK